MQHGKIFLLDGMALIYRAFFAFIQNPRITSTGLNASAMMGFTNTLLEILRKQKPTHIAVVFDTSAPTNGTFNLKRTKRSGKKCPRILERVFLIFSGS
jgi:DNA polymerase-1